MFGVATTADKEDLADYVRRVRKSKGLSMEEVALRSGENGLSKAYVGQIENRYVLPMDISLGKLTALAKGLGIAARDIIAVASGDSKTEPALDPDFEIISLKFRTLKGEVRRDAEALKRALARAVQEQ